MTDTLEAPAIYGAIVAIQSELGNIEKRGRGPSSQGSYPFMPVDDVVAKLGPLLTEHGVAVIPRQASCEQQLFRFPKVTPNGDIVQDGRPDAVQLITRLQYDFDFISMVDGSLVTATAFGESIDTGDKGIRRAATAAYKEVLLRTFTVVSGDEDPDSRDHNDEPAQVVRANRGEQARQRAARGKAERTERAPRAPREQAAEADLEQRSQQVSDNVSALAEGEPTSAEPEQPAAEQPEAAEQPPAEQPASAAAETSPLEAGPAPSAADRRAAAAAARKTRTREEKPPAEQRSDDWKVDPEDVAHAETNAPKAREPQQPVAPPEPVTQEDRRYESVADVRKAIREALAARGLDRDYVNKLGDEVTGKQRGAWFANLNDLHTVLKAIENGEVAGDEGGF